jgi:hypothetical protein
VVTLVRIVAGLALLAGLFVVFRFAMGLRWAKLQRERARAAVERDGRRIVAELPLGEAVDLFLEDAAGFRWGGGAVAHAEIAGARLLLNGGVMASCARPGLALPEPPPPEEFEGRERWEVLVHVRDGNARTVRCGTVREGVSREAASRVFEAIRAVMAPKPHTALSTPSPYVGRGGVGGQ